MFRVVFVGPRAIGDTVCDTSNPRFNSIRDVRYYGPVGDCLVSNKMSERNQVARRDKCLHVIVWTADVNSLCLEM